MNALNNIRCMRIFFNVTFSVSLNYTANYCDKV